MISSDKQDQFIAADANCHDGFLRYCLALAFERKDVKDLVQDVLLSAYRKKWTSTSPALSLSPAPAEDVQRHGTSQGVSFSKAYTG
jgi:DNA-directed RNA polymerase specialized sigma24 family protein